MLIFPPPKFRKHRGRAKDKTNTPTPPAALVLVSADYSQNDWVRLTFDRPIDIAAIDVTQVVVDDDQFTGNRYRGLGTATLLAPDQVSMGIDRIGTASESGVHLFASASTGIVAVDDGGTWTGAEDLALPFPP